MLGEMLRGPELSTQAAILLDTVQDEEEELSALFTLGVQEHLRGCGPRGGAVAGLRRQAGRAKQQA